MNWKFKIQIKDLFKNYPTKEETINLCKMTEKKLKMIRNSRLFKKYEEIDFMLASDLDDLIENFEFVRELIDGTVNEENWEDYEFDGDHASLYNEYLEQLYDLGDTLVERNTKLIWIG